MSQTAAQLVAQALLTEQAVFLRPESPFTWASGIQSPIYCDNRLLISRPAVRCLIVRQMVECIRQEGLTPQVIAGTATAGIPWAAWLAHELDLPMIYVRSSAKDHGRKNLIEGSIFPEARVLLIEDLISTGKSSLAALQALRESQMKVLAVLGLFHYNFPVTHQVFETHQVRALPLCTLDDMLSWATQNGELSQTQAKDILAWRENVKLP